MSEVEHSIKILIIEDEPPAASRLKKMIANVLDNFEVVDVIDSVSSAKKFLKNFKNIDLIFMDIQLSDGLSFEIFNELEIEIPIIFTTAYDGYTLNAFKVNSVDYLLKPIDKDDLKTAIEKFLRYFKKEEQPKVDFKAMLETFWQPRFKERFIIKSGTEIKYMEEKDISYFFSDDGYTHIRSKDNHTFIIDYKLDELDKMINPHEYFRISRKFIVKISSIQKIAPYFNNRLKLELMPNFKNDVIVSRERTSSFKGWLDK